MKVFLTMIDILFVRFKYFLTVPHRTWITPSGWMLSEGLDEIDLASSQGAINSQNTTSSPKKDLEQSIPQLQPSEAPFTELPGKPLKGTNTAIVEISLNELNQPQISVHPTYLTKQDRVIFVGPDEFELIVEGPSPFREEILATELSVLNLTIDPYFQIENNERLISFKITYKESSIKSMIVLREP